MPTYQYRCSKCNHEFEEYQSITEEPLTICPECKAEIHRLISGGAGLLFKGSGFYTTDYRSKEYKASAAKDKPPEKKAEKKSSDSKKSTTSGESKS